MREQIPIAGGDTALPLAMEKRRGVLANHVQPGDLVLDCGCGAGGYVRMMRERLGATVVGVEYLAPKVQEAARQSDVAPFIVRGDIQRLPFASDLFHTVLCNEVIEHVPDDDAALNEIRRVLQPGGKLVIFAPNRLFPFESHGVFLRATQVKVPVWIPLVPYVPFPLGRIVFRYWARNYWPMQLRALVERARFRIVETGYVWQTFENISGTQPGWMNRWREPLRRLANQCEQSPLRCLGISQFLVCQK